MPENHNHGWGGGGVHTSFTFALCMYLRNQNSPSVPDNCIQLYEKSVSNSKLNLSFIAMHISIIKQSVCVAIGLHYILGKMPDENTKFTEELSKRGKKKKKKKKKNDAWSHAQACKLTKTKTTVRDQALPEYLHVHHT